MYSRKIEDCDERLQKLWSVLRDRAKIELGLYLILTCTARRAIEQRALYSQGREPLRIVNQKRELAGLPLISDKENSRRVTWTRNSLHVIGEGILKSKAFDIALVKDGKVIWDIKADINKDNIPDYLQVAELGKSIGLVSGAFFSTPDYPHFQLPQ